MNINVDSVEEHKLYSIRWYILSFLAISAVISRIVGGMVGIVNDVYVAYFQTTYVSVDWITLIQLPGIVLASLLVAMSTSRVSIRQLTIAMAACIVFTTSFFLALYIFPKIYPMIFVTKFIFGFAYVILEAVSSSFSISWFPEQQVGTALSAHGIGFQLGSLLGYLIPSNILISPPPQSMNGTSENRINSTKNQATEDWFHANEIRFIAISSTLLFVSVVTLTFFVLFYADRPPTPPTNAQAVLVPEHSNFTNDKNIGAVVKSFFDKFKLNLQNILFLQTLMIRTISISCYVIQKFLIGQVLREFFIELGYVGTANIMSGYVFVVLDIGSILGEAASGQLVNYNKNYKTLSSTFLLVWIASTVGKTVSYFFRSIAGVFVFSALFGFFQSFYLIPLRELTYQHLYPTKPGFVDLLTRFMATPGSIIISLTFRFIFDKFGGLGVLVYHCAIVFVAFFISLWLKPRYRRLEAGLDLINNESENEETHLLNN